LIGSWREIKFTARESYFKRNWKGVPFNQIPEWVDEGVDIGFIDARTTIRSIAFQKQQRKNAINRLSAVTIVDNSKYGVGQHLSQPKMVTSYRRRKAKNLTHKDAKNIFLFFLLEFRFHLGSVGDLILISVGAEFKRCLFVGQTKYNKTFKPYYDSNNVVVFNDDGSPSGTRILAPIPSWFRDPKEIKKIEQQANKIGWDVQMSKVLAICPQFV